jgi:ribonuclease HII
VIGPLVVSVICVGQGKEKKLTDIGVRDSKMLTKRKRSFLFEEIQSIAEEVKIYKIGNEEINNAMKMGISINQLEAMRFAQLMDELTSKVDKLYLDSPDVLAERFGMRVSLFSKKPTRVIGVKGQGRDAGKIKIISEHKADMRYPVVSGASIIAKVTRDEEMENIEKESGIEIGSGYPGDRYTIDAIKRNLATKRLNPYIREYWKTLDVIRQRKMGEFEGF